MYDLFAASEPEEDIILFGHDPSPGIVAAEPDFEDGLWVYRRGESGVTRERTPYRPWILLSDLPNSPIRDAMLTQLDGDGYRWLAEFPSQFATRMPAP